MATPEKPSPVEPRRKTSAERVALYWPGYRLTILHGSGDGGVTSTSVVQEAMSRIDKSRFTVLPVANISSADLIFPGENSYIVKTLAAWSGGRPLSASPADFVGTQSSRIDQYGDSIPVLGAIDHCETLFNKDGSPKMPEELDKFAQQLEALFHDPDLDFHLLLATAAGPDSGIKALQKKVVPSTNSFRYGANYISC
ncbi:MAG TPA: hypothetical protein VNW29_04810 [Candidatus Sulfotelmatobacter sp.]|jgi:hypothetical protein|nr:hypothetical protein [Candidatus Sulfotelmatobacter sp.]